MSDRYNFRRSTRLKKLKPQSERGSPKDQIPRIKVRMDELDLDKSYAGIIKPPRKSQKPKKPRPWTRRTHDKPLTDPNNLPKGWHMNEDDLDVE